MCARYEKSFIAVRIIAATAEEEKLSLTPAFSTNLTQAQTEHQHYIDCYRPELASDGT